MAARKTLKFLPTIFQTDANQKFLSATLDQLISEPELTNIYGYIGRKFAPTYKTGDSYIIESNDDRQNYQLEPSIQIRDDSNNITFFASYIDVLNKINYYGGNTSDHNRLFDNEYYTYNPHISFDKFVNFSQYYWLPNGPDAVEVNASGVDLEKVYTATRNSGTGRFDFSAGGTVNNTLILARGGVYTFEVNQPGYPFWIQTELGIDGVLNATPTISSRNVLGVENNGIDVGTVTFTVPQSTAQDRFLGMVQAAEVAYANPTAYSDLHNSTLSQFLAAFPQYAGITGNLDGKTLIFIDQDQLNNRGEEIWTNPDVVYATPTVTGLAGNVVVSVSSTLNLEPGLIVEGTGIPANTTVVSVDTANVKITLSNTLTSNVNSVVTVTTTGWGEGEVVPEAQRYGVWRVQFIDLGINDPLIRLVFDTAVDIDEKVYIKYGVANANKEFYKDYDGFFKEMPPITCTLPKLYVQCGIEPSMYTELKIVEYNNWKIDVENDIIGVPTYTSPNGVEFTSGLKIAFDTNVTPATYQNKEYYVEQVGDLGGGIRLVDVSLMVNPEEYNTEIAVNYPGETFPEYITINRSSKDLNAWSRNNRWFHRDVIILTAEYNNTEIVLDQNQRAKRPIIQFDTDLQLLNYGRIGKKPIDILDTFTTNAFTEFEGKVIDSAFGITLFDGMRVLFAADSDPNVRDKIYELSLVQYDLDDNYLPTGPKYIKLTIAEDGDAEPYDSVVVSQGQYKGSQWHYNGTQWLESQQKTQLQQEPLFDVFDSTGKSFSQYVRSDFAGTKLFGYLRSTAGVTDSVLGFALSYRNFNTQGDIEFGNYYTTDTFSYVVDQTVITSKVDSGFLQKIVDRNTLKPKNIWDKVVEDTKQYQLISYVYDGTNSPFELDIAAEIPATIPYIKVFVNKKHIKSTGWTQLGNQITLVTAPAVGDQIDILVYSKSASNIGHYQIPLNLDLNAQNTDITSVTLGQIRNHLVALDQNSTLVSGDVLSVSNLRDVDIKEQGGTILQHSAPMPYSGIFLVDDSINFVDAHRYAQREYTKFKNKFLELSTSLSGIQPTNPVVSVDLILSELNKLKNKTFPWFYSDMVPYGTLKNNITYTIFDPLKTDYEITNVFSDTTLGNTAVLVYLNGAQLIKGKDYAFRTDRPAVTIITPLAVSDTLLFVEYQNTDGNYIPETPTKLGLWPKYVPRIFEDDTYRTPINVIQGHDGSITPAFEDYRDNFLLELEKRIFNNIKLTDSATALDEIMSVIPGKFRYGDYVLEEFNQVLSRSFLSWIGNNKLDFSTNTTFESNDSFTWNYGSLVDKLDGEQLPGSWRACYQYFYDTIRPHITPWEMLGFSIEPSWWQDYYGPGPYTGGNKLLWDDLERGAIWNPTTETYTIDSRYARPGLATIIPVDENGFLISPTSILTRAFNPNRASASWAVGQIGPVEHAWRNSSDFPYAMQHAMALTKPAKYFSLLMDTYNYNRTIDLDQYIVSGTGNHLKQTDLTFNGDTSTGVIRRSAGYLNWIADYLTSQGINPSTKITVALKKYQVNLAYKLSGFTDQNYLNILAEQNSPSSTNDSIVVPAENYKIHLYKSTPVQKMVYSAVIIEKTEAGYTVRGYDLMNPYFTIIPSIVNNNAYKITVLNSTGVVFNDYQTVKLTVPYGYEFNTQQQIVDFLISYERYLVAQGFTFNDVDEQLAETRNWKLSVKEFLFWAQQGWQPGTIVVLSPVSNVVNLITIGSIADGITDSQYGPRIIDQNFKLIKNNEYSVTRSPTDFSVTITNPDSVVGFVELNLVQYEHVLVFDNVTVFNDIIYKPELGNRQYRLKLIGRKTANWDGSLSAPGFIYNSGVVPAWIQGIDYLKGDLVQYKNQYYTALSNIVASAEFNFNDWKLLPATEIKQGLLPNFSTIAVGSQSFYDSYPIIDNNKQIEYSHGLIGFKPRQYLSDLGVSTTTQIEFYKGFIKQKGTANAVNELLTAEFNNLTSNINFYEEWAMRLGEYGALNSNPYLDIALDEAVFGVNPSIAEFVTGARNNEGDGISIFNKSQLYKSYDGYDGNIALVRTSSSNYDNDIPTAGYVNIDDVDATLFDLANISDLNEDLAGIGIGYTIWVAKDFTQSWNVFRITETDNTVTTITNALDGYITITTASPHGLVADDIFLVTTFDTQFDGFYRVSAVPDLNSVTVVFVGNTDNLTEFTGVGELYVLRSVRFKYMEDCREFGRPPHGWKEGEVVWIDDDAETTEVQGQPYSPSKTWKVYEKTNPWTVKQPLDKAVNEYTSEDGFGTSIRMSADGLLSVVGNPQTEVQELLLQGATITANIGSYITQLASNANAKVLNTVTNSYSVLVRYTNGTPLSQVGNLYVNGINTGSTIDEIVPKNGIVNTFLKDSDDIFQENFNIIPTAANTSQFGYAVDLAITSDQDSILGVGAPGSSDNTGYVFVYHKSLSSTAFDQAQIVLGNLSATSDEFGSSLAFSRNGDWLYVGAPGHNSNAGAVYIYGLNRFVPEQLQITSINDEYIINLSGNLSVSYGDIIRQPATGAEALVQAGSASTNRIKVSTATNFLTTGTGNISIANIADPNGNTISVLGNITVNNVDVGVYPEVVENYSITDDVPLNFTPYVNDSRSLLITGRGKTYIPEVDYTLDYANLKVNFSANVVQGDLSIIQQPYYTLLDVKTGNANSRFGYALSSSFDGAQLAVGAPNDIVNVIARFGQGEITSIEGDGSLATPWLAKISNIASTYGMSIGDTIEATSNVGALFGGTPESVTIYSIDSLTDITYAVVANGAAALAPIYGTIDNITTIASHPGAGAVWVYDRVIEAFNSDGGQDYVTENLIQSVYKVTIDELEVNNYFVLDDNRTIRFITPPPIGKVIFVETNQFNLLEKLIGIDSLEGGLSAIQTDAQFGTSLTICSNNCAIYVGAPNYDSGPLYNTGAVWKFHSRGRLYGTNTGYLKDPTFKPNDSIRLDNFEVRVSLGLTSNVRANVGEFITQTISGANVTVLASTPVDGSNIIQISGYNNANVFTLDSGNISVNGTEVDSVPRRATLDEFVDDVNRANILGVSAVNENGLLRLDSDKTVAKNLLRILSGTGTIFEDSQLAIFAFMQIIINPFDTAGEYFGSKVKLAPNAYMLVIGSSRGTTKDYATFDLDTEQTLFDADSTRWYDNITGSGSVYIYELYDDPRDAVENPGRYQYCQQLNTEDLNTGDQFGYAIDIEAGYVMVSAPGDSTTAAHAGTVYVFENPKRTRGWNLIRYQQPTVDIDSINRLYLYNNESNTILQNLQYIDPTKGKILGEAEQEITYKTAFDPARYNRGTNGASDIYWTDVQVGHVWWNLDQVRFVDYEQDSLTYRSINWGRLFPGSQIEVCEWVQSSVLPSQYADNGGNGQAKFVDNSAYVEVMRVDPNTNIISSVYYYWVINKTTVDPNDPTRNMPLTTITDFIANPKSQGIPYAAIIQNNAIILYNVGPLLSAKNTILHIDHDLLINTNIIHSEYQLVQKGNPDDFIPNKIVNKLIDSLAGLDSMGSVVPDPKLSLADRYGIGFRPRQSMFVDRLKALNELVAYVNDILIQYPIARQYDLTQLNSSEPEPSFKLGEYHEKIATDTYLAYIDTAFLSPGHKILVENDTTQDGLWVLYELTAEKTWEIIRVQSYKTNLYWEYVDWYAEGFDSTEIIEYVVDTLPDALKLPAAPGEEILVKVSNSDAGGWNLLTVLDTGEFNVVGIQNGTIQLKPSLGNYADNGLGFGNQGFSTGRYDQNPNIEIRSIINGLKDNIFIDTLSGEFNNTFFTMMNYLFTEQKYVDWIFKTSFVSVTHQLRTLSQFPSYIEDNQDYYQSYINEVKPYRTKIREYLISYTGNDEYQGSVTDFDLTPYYDTEMKVFRSPSGEEIAKDEALWQTDTYNQWYKNKAYQVDSILVENGGSGYTVAPEVTVIANNAGTTPVKAQAFIDGDTGAVIRIDVISAGSGFVKTPTVIVNGSSTVPATAYAVLKNNLVRTFDTTLKFDRVSYGTSVNEWQANTPYVKTMFNETGAWVAGDVVTHAQLEGNTYIRTAYQILANATSGNTFVASDYAIFSAANLRTANDRIIGYYQPGSAMPARDLTQLVYGIDYPGVQVQGVNFNQQPGFPGTAVLQVVLNSNVNVYRGNVITQGNASITITNNAIGSSVIYGDLNSTADFVVNSGNISIDGAVVAAYPIRANLYASSSSGTPFDTGEFDNIDYDADGLPILGSSAVDTSISSTYLDTAIGTRAEDINVDGGAYVDTYSSHAPEELIPGRVFDTLDMQVYTKIEGNTKVLGYRIFNNMMQETSYLRIADAYTTTLARTLSLTDTDIVVEDSSVLPTPNPETATPGIVFIGTERITYYTKNDTTNTLGQIRRGTHGTAIIAHTPGAKVVDSSLTQNIPGITTGNLTVTTNTAFTVSTTVSHKLTLTGNISANVGDFITQATTGANVTVIGINSANTSVVLVEYNTVNAFNYFVGNIVAASNLAINGTYTGNTYPLSSVIEGNTYPYWSNVTGWGLDASGNVTVLNSDTVDTVLQQSNVWSNVAATVSAGSYELDTTSLQVLFLKEAPATNTVVSTVSQALVAEDTINTLTTEDGQTIFEEDQE